MKKNIKIFLTSFVVTSLISLCVGLFALNSEPSSANNEYSIVFNNNNNRLNNKQELLSGDKEVKTLNNNLVSFHYNRLAKFSDHAWQALGAPSGESYGCFFNNTRINGISSLELNFVDSGANFTIEYSKDADFSEKYTYTDVTSKSTMTFDFDNYSPNYFKFINTSNTSVEIKSMVLNLSCVIKYPTVKITSEDTNKGTIYSSHNNIAVKEGTIVTIAAFSNDSFTFIGWYNTLTNKIYSEDLYLKITVGNEDISLEAKFKSSEKYKMYAVAEENGKSEGSGEYLYNDMVLLKSIANEGYASLGWFDINNEQVSENPEKGFLMPNHDVCYITKFSKEYQITKITIGSGEIKGPDKSIAGKEVTLIASPDFSNKYAFHSWKDENKEILSINSEFTFIMPENNITRYAEFQIGLPLVIDFNKDHGTVKGNGYYLEGRTVKISATPINGYIFDAWYYDNNYTKLLSRKSEYEITFPSDGITIYAKFLTKDEEWNRKHGVIPSINEGGKTLTFGLYPKTHINDSSLIEELQKIAAEKKDEEYFIYENEYYVKDTGNPYKNDGTYKFLDGTKVVNGTIYYFKCEPITWNIIKNDTNSFLIDCSNILYAHRFDNDSNSYSKSELRTFLNNGEFFNSAFYLNGTPEHLIETYLDDIEVTDKVWLGSKNQYNGDWYKSDNARVKKVTDFALCNHAYMSTYDTYLRNGTYWNRSTFSAYSAYEGIINYDGGLNGQTVDHDDVGVSPSLVITLKS